MESNIKYKILDFINNYLNSKFQESEYKLDNDYFLESLKVIFNDSEIRYDLNNILSKTVLNSKNTVYDHKLLSNINEKNELRKELGVYYTPLDVVESVVLNSFILWINKKFEKIYNFDDKYFYEFNNKELLFNFIKNTTIFDPTCGSGEFLVQSLIQKLEIASSIDSNGNDELYLSLLSTIFGNDIDIISIDIVKLRLLLVISDFIDGSNLINAANILNMNFSSYNLLDSKFLIDRKFDIILGNPPYVEDNKSKFVPDVKYGNIFANILEISTEKLGQSGVISMILPISFMSTPRMSKIREKIDIKINTKLLITFADRPDSLFKTVHQKLIIFYGLNNGISQTLTSSYLTWYKSEREMLLKNINLHKNNFCENNFIPKIGNELEESVYSKIYNKSSLNNLRQKFTKKKFIDKDFIFLNSRATFFIKVFKHNPGSKEYKQYFIEKNETLGVIALLSSSIYFMFWSIVSDCWHITNKEFDIIIPDGLFESKKIQDLTLELLDKLEKTKKFIGSKQIDYEYKHKDCIDVIHQIDEEIYNLYYLNSLEKEYIKNYRIKYRLGQNYEQGN